MPCKLTKFSLVIAFSFGILSSNSDCFASSYVIAKQLDLKGDTLRIAEGRALHFKKGARIKNGVIVGNNTSIYGELTGVFDNVTISGSWNVPVISTSMFVDIHKDNALQNIFALTSQNVRNKVSIAKGVYWVSASRDWQSQLMAVANTEIILDGTIRMRPNAFKGYKILDLNGDNIHLHGHGTIFGDKNLHKRSEGEWGMGVNISSGKNIKVNDLSILNCWGDCIYVGGKASGVKISNCRLEGSRRQGISITSAGCVYIENCTIRNVGGTAPEYAIDVEPNAGDTVKYVLIRNVKAIDCKGGFMSWRDTSKKSYIGAIDVENCSVTGNVKHYDYSFEHVSRLRMKNNFGNGKQIRLIGIDDAELINNTIEGQWLSDYMIRDCKKVVKK